MDRLSIGTAADEHSFTQAELLTRPDVSDVVVPHDVAYGRTMTFRAMPLASLLDEAAMPTDTVLEAVAADGFAAQLPRELVLNRNPVKAVAMLAIEEPQKPWPALPGKTVSAGPFYIVWIGTAADTVRSEYWPYQILKLAQQDSPAKRWPQIAVDPTVPDDDPLRTGQTLFIAQCLACHTMNGAGTARIGPDLNVPMNPTEYLVPSALAQLIRNPASVRSWPTQQMPPMAESSLSDDEIGFVIGYLKHMAERKTVTDSQRHD